MTPGVHDPNRSKGSKLPWWLGALPGVVFASYFAIRAFVQMGHAAGAVSGYVASKPSKSLTCLEAYSVNLTNSQFYVPEGQQFAPQKNIEPSTVVSGMIRNDCGELLKSVTIHINVRDDTGKRGDGSVMVSDLNPGEAKPFSKAWMGRVTSYEITKIR